MRIDATLAILHHLFAFGFVGLAMAQWALLRGPASEVVIRRLARYDALYGLSAATLFLVGLGRVFHGLKGAAFYAGSPFFWIKLGLFVIGGTVSVLPTLRYRRWAHVGAALPAEALWAGTRKLVVLQLHLMAGIMICAALMARGIGAGG